MEGDASVFDSIFSVTISAALSGVAAVVGWLLGRVDKTKSLADGHEIRLNALEKKVESFDKIPERITTLEVQVKSSFEELQRGLSRIEAHMIRQEKRGFNDE